MAFGGPGLEPCWATGRKDGVGTAYSADSRIWFTLADGILTEVFFPTIDTPQLRDMQFMVTDGSSFFLGEQDLLTEGERLADHALGYKVTNTDPDGRFTLRKEVISDPHLPCVLQHVALEGRVRDLRHLKFYVLAAPHLGGGGAGNSGFVYEIAGRHVLVANRGSFWLALGAMCRSPAPAWATLVTLPGLTRLHAKAGPPAITAGKRWNVRPVASVSATQMAAAPAEARTARTGGPNSRSEAGSAELRSRAGLSVTGRGTRRRAPCL